MRRRVLLCFVLAVASGCQGGDAVRPFAASSAPPAHLINDGNHAGNPDFFFLPPVVADPSASPNWSAGAFDGTQQPKVVICELVTTPTSTASQVAAAKCLAGGYAASYDATVSLTSEQYQYNWQVPTSAAVKYYRVSVVVKTNQLGRVDLEAVPNSSKLKNAITLEDVPLLNDGRTLPIKFRIERGALNTAVVTVNLKDGGQVSTILPETGSPSGIYIPPQGGDDDLHTITVEACDSFNARVTDLPVFGPCVRVKADPALPTSGFTNAATVFVCDVDEPAAILQGAKDEDQAHLITLHRLDPAPNNGQVVTALPHAPGCNTGAPPFTTASVNSFKGMLADLAHGHLKAAARTLAGLVAPKDLNAAMFIDLGGGGFTQELSDFQFALPAKFDVAASGLTTSASPFGVNIKVTDLHGGDVSGARVHFLASGDGLVADDTLTTKALGVVATTWTTSSDAARLTAFGRGIGGSDYNGPREGVDPFQPIHGLFDDGADDGGPVPVLTGSLVLLPGGLPEPKSLDVGVGYWRYLQPTDNGPSGWQGSGERAGWPTGAMAFGTAPCVAATKWDGTKDLLATKAFTVPSSGDLAITVRVFDQMELFLDNMQVKASSIVYSATTWPGTQASWSGPGCSSALTNVVPPLTFSIMGVPAGLHTIAIHAHSAPGGTPYLDVKLTLTPPAPVLY